MSPYQRPQWQHNVTIRSLSTFTRGTACLESFRSISLANRLFRIPEGLLSIGAQSDHISARLCDPTAHTVIKTYIISSTPTTINMPHQVQIIIPCYPPQFYPLYPPIMGCRFSRPRHSDEDYLVDSGERQAVRRTQSKERHVQAQIEKNGLHLIPLRHANSETPGVEAQAEVNDAAKGR